MVEELSLTVAGEPFLTPRLPEFLGLAERWGAELALNTNGTLLKDNPHLERILRLSSVIRVSIDGARPETYASIRKNGELSTVIENVRAMLAVRAGLPREERPRIVCCMVLMRRNVEELVEMVRFCVALGLDRLDVAHLTVLVPEMEEESLRHHPQVSDRMFWEARKEADRLGFRLCLPPLTDGSTCGPSLTGQRKLALREIKEAGPRKLKRLARTLQRKAHLAQWSLAAGGRVPCHFLQSAAFINIQGEVAPCPMPGRPIAGDLRDRSFSEIWNGEVLTQMRRGFLEGKPMACCAHCSQNPVRYDPVDPQTVAPPSYELPGLAVAQEARRKARLAGGDSR